MRLDNAINDSRICPSVGGDCPRTTQTRSSGGSSLCVSPKASRKSRFHRFRYDRTPDPPRNGQTHPRMPQFARRAVQHDPSVRRRIASVEHALKFARPQQPHLFRKSMVAHGIRKRVDSKSSEPATRIRSLHYVSTFVSFDDVSSNTVSLDFPSGRICCSASRNCTFRRHVLRESSLPRPMARQPPNPMPADHHERDQEQPDQRQPQQRHDHGRPARRIEPLQHRVARLLSSEENRAHRRQKCAMPITIAAPSAAAADGGSRSRPTACAPPP